MTVVTIYSNSSLCSIILLAHSPSLMYVGPEVERGDGKEIRGRKLWHLFLLPVLRHLAKTLFWAIFAHIPVLRVNMHLVSFTCMGINSVQSLAFTRHLLLSFLVIYCSFNFMCMTFKVYTHWRAPWGTIWVVLETSFSASCTLRNALPSWVILLFRTFSSHLKTSAPVKSCTHVLRHLEFLPCLGLLWNGHQGMPRIDQTSCFRQSF